jgi:hypothetical protein
MAIGATHGEPDWPAIARPAVDHTARVLAARRHHVLVVHAGVAWRPGSPEMNTTAPLFSPRPRPVGGGHLGGAGFYAPVAPAPGEVIVYKRGGERPGGNRAGSPSNDQNLWMALGGVT